MYWINTYQKLLNYLVYNTGRNFLVTKFKQHTKLIVIGIKEVPIKAYNSIGKVERYHTPL